MFSKYKLTDREKIELNEYRGTGLNPRQIRRLNKQIIEMREYIEFLENS